MSDQKARAAYESRTGQIPRIVVEEMLARREASRQKRVADADPDPNSVTGIMRSPLKVEDPDDSAQRDTDSPRQDGKSSR